MGVLSWAARCGDPPSCCSHSSLCPQPRVFLSLPQHKPPFTALFGLPLCRALGNGGFFSAMLRRWTYPLAAAAFAKCRVCAWEAWFHSALNMKCHLLRSLFLAVLRQCDAAACSRAPSKREISGELAESPCPRLPSLRMGSAACLGGEVVLTECGGRDVAVNPLCQHVRQSWWQWMLFNPPWGERPEPRSPGRAGGSRSLAQEVATARASLGLCRASPDRPPWHRTVLVGVVGSPEWLQLKAVGCRRFCGLGWSEQYGCD